jgi:MYXO-CTERM domain-containing protein
MHATCENLSGSFNCACAAGLLGTGLPGGCIDIDECADGGGCGEHEQCINRYADANLCRCAPGYARLVPDGPCLLTCGDGIRGEGEECDDGNEAPDDGCDAHCLIESGFACYDDAGTSVCERTCGDGVLRVPGEECDDGGANSDTAPDACRTICRAASCGDGVVDTGEECDDGDANSDLATGACRTTCKEAFCGDGVLDQGERCDYGRGEPLGPGGCTSECLRLPEPDAGAGDGIVGHARSGGCGVAAGGGTPWTAVVFVMGLAVGVVRRRRRR